MLAAISTRFNALLTVSTVTRNMGLLSISCQSPIRSFSKPMLSANTFAHKNGSFRVRGQQLELRFPHSSPWMAMSQQQGDRSQRYSGTVIQPPSQPSKVPTRTPMPPKSFAASRSPGSVSPSQRQTPLSGITIPAETQPPQQPLQHSASSPQESAVELISENYGVPVRPGTGRMVLVDALPLLYKAHFAFPHGLRLRSAQGVDTTVLYIFLNMLLNLLSITPAPTHFAVVLDAAGKNFRHELYADYKGQRPDMPDEIRAVIPQLMEMLQAMGISVFNVPGVEADDVLGTLAVRGVQEGMVVAIASPDKDFFQLLRMGLILLRPPKKQQYHQPAAIAVNKGGGEVEGEHQPAPVGKGSGGPPQQRKGGGEKKISKFMLLPYTVEDFKQEWDLSPAQFVDLLALAGDATDNVPGVAGIGPKTAATLLRQFGSLDNVLARAAEVPKRAGAALQSPQGAAAARLSKQLVRIETGLDIPPLKLPLDELRLRAPPDGGRAVLGMCHQLDFKTHEERLQKLWAGQAFQHGNDNSTSESA